MKSPHNFLPEQYDRDSALPINHNYLGPQFADCEPIFDEIRQLVRTGDYTLGRAVDVFEKNISALTGSKHCLGVGSGTDALFLSLKAAGVGPGDEVVTTPYTFFGTVSAIVATGARPIFVDIRDDYNIDPDRVAAAFTGRTKALLPVHWSGCCCEMEKIMAAARYQGVAVIEDACHAVRAYYQGKAAGTFGLTGCFSLHPLKNLNVWGDGGYIVTDSDEVHEKLSLLRNHGLVNRNECAVFAYNSRLDTLQAIVANHLLKRIDAITSARVANAARYDRLLTEVSEIRVPARRENTLQVFHIYVVRSSRRDELVAHLRQHGIDAKVHYPIPVHLQPAARHLGYRPGDFPVCEAVCDSVLSLPVHEYITADQIHQVVGKIKEFHARD